jgi:N-[(2S)-2-amino-2-carboxyethyl]-L-glutamate dehydrogenase
MLYLNKEHIESIGIEWNSLVQVIRETVVSVRNKDYSQPIKPYLRYGDPKNRIIAMPAYIGGKHPFAGIKWIASFPENIFKNRARANSVTILNEYDTGVPLCAINTNLVSAIRTAAVSGIMIDEYLKIKKKQAYRVGIVGLGPIGRMHLKMIGSMLKGTIETIGLYDIKKGDPAGMEPIRGQDVFIADSWQECYDEADIFIACTVADHPYIDRKPKPGSLQLNVSLRDYEVTTRKFMDIIVVDDWTEVCRQNTDIENMPRGKRYFFYSRHRLHQCIKGL